MKLYVWTGVLRDYTNGMAFAIANNYKEAVEKASGGLDYVAAELIPSKCAEYELDTPIGFYIWGGG